MPVAPEYISELPRYRALTCLRKYYEGTQYEGRPDFFTGQKPNGEVVPLRERKPCIIYPLPRAAVNQVVRFTFGESRFPRIRFETIDKSSAVAGERLTEDEAKELDTFVKELIDRCDLKPGMRRVMRPGLAVGTACVIIALKNGCFTLKTANAEDVQAKFRDDDPAQSVESITWCYQHELVVPDARGRPQTKRFWYRLDVDAQAYIEYEGVEVKQGETPAWRVAKRVEHGYGFCPVVWCRNVEDEDRGDIDGQSLYEDLCDEFDALNLALSQRHRGVNFFGVPQPWETGVDEDDGPQATGRTARAFSPANDAKAPYGKVLGADGRPARPISPQNMWTYRSETTKVGLLETTGKAFEAATLHVNDIRSRALEAMSVVLVNVSEIANRTQQGQMSAKFLELAYEPLLALVDEMRHCWWPNGLQTILSMMLRIVAVLNGRGIWVPGADKAAAILNRFNIETETGNVWMPPKMTPAWGDYFSAGPEEIGAAVDTAGKAKNLGLVPTDDASRYVLPYFDREDVNDALEDLHAEAEEKAAEQQKQFEFQQKAGARPGNGAPPKNTGSVAVP